jgi:histidinol dehydrogenase
MKDPVIRLVKWIPGKADRAVDSFLARHAFDDAAEKAASKILADVRSRGDMAVCAWARRLDRAVLKPASLRVGPGEIQAARRRVDARFRSAVRAAMTSIRKFAVAGLKSDWRMPTRHGGSLGERFIPLDRVGIYVPGGTAPLASTVLMTAVLARAAGVKNIVACTPCGRDGKVNPYLLYALAESGVSEIYRVGGIQAIGMMAYGTRTVPKVQKIVGPGNAYVTAAKRQVYGEVALDLVAGPSEIAVLADDTADPAHVAADLLSQAEHGSGLEKALLVTPSTKLAREVRRELQRQTRLLGRRGVIRRVMRRGMLLVVVRGLADGMKLCNLFAPEHLEILTRNPRKWLGRVSCAGAVFVGTWTPEAAGDFAAGPSHVLPTGGAAMMFSGLTADDFRRRCSVMAFSRKDLAASMPVIEAFGRVEGLDAHVRSAQVRFEKK